MKKVEIVIGTVVDITDTGIKLFISELKKYGFCAWKDLSDFEENQKILAVIDSKYKFLNLKELNENNLLKLSYKYVHPEEQTKKTRIIPTASHFSNLHKNMFNKLNYNFSQKEDDVYTYFKTFRDLYNNSINKNTEEEKEILS